MSTMTGLNTHMNISSISQPRLFSHLNGLAMLLGAGILYGIQNGDWGAFLLLLLLPDVFMLGYALNQAVGTWVYNIGHSLFVPFMLMVLGHVLGWDAGISLGFIWLAHIGMDWIFGYGYKYADEAFAKTHFSRI